MAGIGFRLQKLLSGESYSDLIRAYLYSSVISAGPMIIVIATLALVKLAFQSRLTIEECHVFLTVTVYVYAFSMVFAGPFLYVVTRYIADKYYLKQIETFTPIYLSNLEFTFAFQAPIAIFFLYPLPFPFGVKLTIFFLYLFVSAIWVAMYFLSAARNYLWIVGAFVLGGLVGFLSAFYLGRTFGFSGYLKGFTLGQGITFTILTLRVFAEFGYKFTHDYGFVIYFKKHPYLSLVGFCYYLGIWIDKFIFWFTQGERSSIAHLKDYPNYDIPMFLAFMTVVPSMAFFLIQMETTFFRHYQAYYQSIQNRENLDAIRARQKNIASNLTRHFQKFAVFQGLVSGLIIVFIYPIADAFYLNTYQLGVFRIAILGSFLFMGYVMVLNIFFYFEFQKEGFIVSLIFLTLNGGLTTVTLYFGLPAYGFGYSAASFLTVVIGFFLLDNRLHHLNYWTFMKQPIILPKFKLESDRGQPATTEE